MKSSIKEAIEIVTESSQGKLDRGFMKYADARSKEKLERLLPKLDVALAGGDIWNVDWVDLNDEIARVFGVATSRISERFTEALKKYREEHPDYRNPVFSIYYDYISAYPHMIPQKIKNLKTLKTRKAFKEAAPYVTDEMYQELLDVFEEFEPVALALKETKDKIKKGRQPNPDAKTAYVPPAASKTSMQMIQDKVEEVTKSMYESLVKSYRDYFNGIVDRYFARRSKDNESPYRMREFQGGQASMISSFITNVPKGHKTATTNDPYRKRDNYEELIERSSKAQADIVRDRYKFKMMQKLGSIVSKKSEKGVALKSVSVGHMVATYGTFEGWMNFEFEDGSKFRVQNKVITKWSQRGNPFHQYPTTFHDVKFHTGKTYKMRSEEQMNKEFIEDKIEN
jgi:hypothetical protein